MLYSYLFSSLLYAHLMFELVIETNEHKAVGLGKGGVAVDFFI